MSLSRKAINFDLSTEELKKYFKESTAPAYSAIKNFMLENGFEYRQDLGYASKEQMSDKQINLLIRRLSKQFPWLSICVREFNVSDIGKQRDLTHLFKK